MSPANAAAGTSTIALLHLAPRAGDVAWNKRAIERGALAAAAAGARLVVTPELAVSGYGFRDVIGTDWIAADQAALAAWAGGVARRAGASLVLGLPEAGPDGGLFNAMALFAPDGAPLGRHRKVNVLRTGSESWSSPGDGATALAIEGIGRAGFMVCADMYSRRLVAETAALGCDLLLSSAAWSDGFHGPNGEWEWSSLATGRPVLVCNRTGVDVMDFSAARSVAAVDGAIAGAHAAAGPGVVLVDWNPADRRLRDWRVVALEP